MSAGITRGRALLASLALCALALTGCAPEPSQVETVAPSDQHIITVDGLERSYVAHVPEGAEIGAPLALPMLVVLHGAGGNGARAQTATGLTALAKANDFIVVYPNGTQAADIEGQLAWNADGCCGRPRADRVDDVAFITAMIDDLEQQYAIDDSRIFLTGFSNGGMMSYKLSCALGDRIAGLAVVSGAYNVSSCKSDAPASVLIVHGTGDLTVPYDGGPTNSRTAGRFGMFENESVADATREWVARNECDSDPAIRRSGLTSRAVYEDCEAPLEVVTIANGQHVWPIAPTSGFDASDFIVEYFGLAP